MNHKLGSSGHQSAQTSQRNARFAAHNSMSRLTSAATLLFCLAAITSRAVVLTNAPPMQIVTCRKDTDLDALIAEFHLAPKFLYRTITGFAAPMDEATTQTLKADARVRWVETDGKMSLAGQTIPSGLKRIGIDHFPVAHINGVPKQLDVDVAVLDSGINPHEDLNVYDTFTAFGFDGSDIVGHGTGVSGVIAAIDNEFGIVGVCPGVRLWNVRVFGPPPDDAWTNFLIGLDYVAQHSNQVSVMNISIVNLETNAPIVAMRLLIRKLVDAGIVVVAGAGNSERDLAGLDGIYGTGDDAVPAALPEVMAVSAMDHYSDSMTSFSNFSQIERTNGYPIYSHGVPTSVLESNYVHSPGGAIDVAAPGYGILVTWTNNDYVSVLGTSVAAPHVTGLVALYIAANGRATNAEGVYKIRQAIIDASLPQSQWNTNNTHDPDSNPEPLAIASESWIPKPEFTAATGTSGNFQLSFNAVPGYDYTLQSTTNLTQPVVWTDLITIPGSNSVAAASMADTNTGGQNFYQIKRTPSP
jgi:subtilisin family serine protease